MLNQEPSISLSGLDYEIPMNYELIPPIHCPNFNKRIKYPQSSPPFLGTQQRLLQNNIDLEREAGCGHTQWGLGVVPRKPTRGSEGRTVGVDPVFRNDSIKIKRQQEREIANQQFGPKPPKCGPQLSTDFKNREETKSEKNIFGDLVVAFPEAATQTFPNPLDTPSGFFETTVPPPNTLLMSNISPERQFQLKERFSVEDTDPLQTIAASNAISRATGSKFGAVTPGFQESGYLNTSGLPTPSSVQPSRPKSEFQIARSSLERDMKKIIETTIAQQTRALMCISDLRHSISGLEQRIVESRAHNQPFDVASASQRLDKGLKTIEELRDLIRAIQARRARALDELKGPLTDAEYGSIQTVLANTIKLMEANVRQYHAQPADDSIEAFQKPHFGGDGFVMKKTGAPNGFYDYPNVGGLGNNELKSLKIGASVRVNLYERPNKQGKMLTYVGPRRITLLPTLWTNAVSGIEILEKTGPVVELWDAPFYQGAHVRLPIGTYDYPDVGGIKAGKTGSISIPDGINVTVYSQAKLQGEKLTFLGPQKVPFLPADWNKKVFGIEITSTR